MITDVRKQKMAVASLSPAVPYAERAAYQSGATDILPFEIISDGDASCVCHADNQFWRNFLPPFITTPL